MAAETPPRDMLNALSREVSSWERRLRLLHSWKWLPRSILPGLFIGIGIALYTRLERALITDIQIILGTVAVASLGVALMLLIIWLRPRRPIESARRFDVLFGLRERVSTALELLEGRIRADDELAEYQIEDALNNAQGVRADQFLPLTTKRRDWAYVGVLTAALAVLLLVFAPESQASANPEQEAAITSAAEEVQEITQDVAADPSLTEPEREELLETLQTAQERLQDPDISAEEAFATMNDVQAALEEQAEQMQQEIEAQQNAMQQAAEALNDQNQDETTPENESTESESPSLSEMLNEMSQNLDSMTEEQRQQAADALQQAADALESTDPRTSDALQEASEALRNGDTQSAQEAIQDALDSLQQNAQQQSQESDSAQQMQESAESAQQAASEIAQQSQQSQEGQSQEGQEGQEGEEGQESESGQQGDEGEQGQEGEEGQEGQEGQGQQEGEEGQEGQQGQGQQEGEGSEGQSGEGQQGQGGNEGVEALQPGGEQGANNGGQEAGGGAGDQEGTEDGSAAQNSDTPPGQNNNPDGEGEREFEPVAPPRNLGGEGSDEIELEANPEGAPVTEGDIAQNPDGESVVPYNEFFGDYTEAVNRALDGDYIPIGLRDVVRGYFTSLEPGANDNDTTP